LRALAKGNLIALPGDRYIYYSTYMVHKHATTDKNRVLVLVRPVSAQFQPVCLELEKENRYQHTLSSSTMMKHYHTAGKTERNDSI